MAQEPHLTQEVQRNTYDTRNTMTHEGTRGTWIRNLLEALMTQKTHETHRALTTSVATTCNEEHIIQKEPSFICKCILGYICFIYDTYDTSNKVKFMLYEVSKTHVIQETQKNTTVISAIIGSDSLFGVRYGSYGYWVGPGVLPDGSDPI